MFEPYLKSFYIRSTDPTQIKILKVSWKYVWQDASLVALGLPGAFPVGQLSSMPWGQEDSKDPVSQHCALMLPVSPFFPQLEVLTNLANETNISTILREFQVCHGHTGVPPWHGSGCQNTTMEGTEESPTRRTGLKPGHPHGWLQRSPTCDYHMGGCPSLACG